MVCINTLHRIRLMSSQNPTQVSTVYNKEAVIRIESSLGQNHFVGKPCDAMLDFQTISTTYFLFGSTNTF